MKFGRPMGKVPRAKGKGGKQEMLPSRHAMSQLVNGTPEQRSLGNYAKLSPAGLGQPSDDIMAMGEKGVDIE